MTVRIKFTAQHSSQEQHTLMSLFRATEVYFLVQDNYLEAPTFHFALSNICFITKKLILFSALVPSQFRTDYSLIGAILLCRKAWRATEHVQKLRALRSN